MAMGTTPSHAIPLDQDELEEEEDDFHPFRDLDSDSEGGMQLDSPEEREQRYIADGDTIPYEAGVWEVTRDGTSISSFPRLLGYLISPGFP